MISRLKLRLWIWLLDHELTKCQPWEDPRRSAEDRALWLEARPKSLANHRDAA